MARERVFAFHRYWLTVDSLVLAIRQAQWRHHHLQSHCNPKSLNYICLRTSLSFHLKWSKISHYFHNFRLFHYCLFPHPFPSFHDSHQDLKSRNMYFRPCLLVHPFLLFLPNPFCLLFPRLSLASPKPSINLYHFLKEWL